MQEPQYLLFGPFRLDLRDERLWQGQKVIHVSPKTLAVLRELVAQAGRLMTRDALLAAVWPGTAVSESVLTVAIRELRRALGDRARRPQIIETVHSRGYRFIAPVAVAELLPRRHQSAGTWRPPQPVAPVLSEPFVGREGELAQLHQWFTTALQGKRQVGIIAGEPGIGKTTLVDTFVAQVTAVEALRVGHGQCVELVLDYLSEAEVAAYLCQRFEDTRLAADLARVLHRRTNGNPLFLTAMIDELLRQQVVQKGPDGWEVRKGVERIITVVPTNLRALIELQLAHLAPEDQTLLEAASVAGVKFPAPAVAAALDRADEAVEACCLALAHQGQFLQVCGRAEWPNGTVTACYSFIHALYQEVLYQQTPAGRLSRWHARIGTRLAQGFGEGAGDMAAALPMHFVRGRLLPQAVQYLRQAGQQAAQRGAHQEAVTYFEQALAALAQLPERRDTLEQAIDLRFDLRNALQPLNEQRRIFDHLRVAETIAERLGDSQRLGRIASHLCVYFLDIGEPDRAMVAGQQAFALATIGGDFDVQITAQIYLGLAYHAVGDFRQALDVSRQAMTSLTGELRYERFVMASLPAVVSRFCMVRCLAELGGFTEGSGVGEDAMRIAEVAEHPYSIAAALMFVGFLYRRQGDPEKAIPVLERSLALSRSANIPRFFPLIASTLSAAYTLAGRLTEAHPLLEQMLERIATGRRLIYHALVLIELSEACLLVGRVDAARTLVEYLLEIACIHAGRGYQAHALRLLGDVARVLDPPVVEQATAHYRQALGLAKELGMRPLQAHCHMGLGTLYTMTGQREQANTALSAAIFLYRALDMRFWLTQADAALARIHSSDR